MLSAAFIQTLIHALVDAPTLMAIRATELVFAWSLTIQTLEYLRMGKYTADDAFWSWPLQRADIPNAPVRALFDVLFKPQMHQLHLVLRLCAVVALAVQGASLPLIGFLFVGNLLILIRWRGAFNGGSDFMTLVVLTGLLISQVVGALVHVELGWQAGFWYIAIQAITSYFMSGAVKLLRREWRNGSAMTIFLNGAIYGPLSATHPLRNKWLAMLGSALALRRGEHMRMTALVANGLRHKVRLQVDGGLKTGLDIIKAAILKVASEKPDDFTTADVRAALGDYYDQIPEPRVLGTIMRQLKAAGVISPTDRSRPSGLKINHNCNQRVWKKVR